MRLLATLLLLASTLAFAGAGKVIQCAGGGKRAFADGACPPGMSPIGSRDYQSSEAVKPVESKSVSTLETMTLTLHQSAGMYRAPGTVNGTAVNFLVDTGASSVSIPERMAFSAGLRCAERGKSRTANGTTDFCRSDEAEIGVGPFLVKGVRVVILPNLDTPLLGMSVLRAFRIEHEGTTLKITQKKEK